MKRAIIMVRGSGSTIVDLAKGVIAVDEWFNDSSRSLCTISFECFGVSYWGTGEAVIHINMLQDVNENVFKNLIEDCFKEVDMNECYVEISEQD